MDNFGLYLEANVCNLLCNARSRREAVELCRWHDGRSGTTVAKTLNCLVITKNSAKLSGFLLDGIFAGTGRSVYVRMSVCLARESRKDTEG